MNTKSHLLDIKKHHSTRPISSKFCLTDNRNDCELTTESTLRLVLTNESDDNLEISEPQKVSSKQYLIRPKYF